jgi:hypothetical protein
VIRPEQPQALKERRFSIAAGLAGGFKPPLLEAARRSPVFRKLRISSFKNAGARGSNPAFREVAMNTSHQTHAISDSIIDSRRLISGLRHALDMNYARVLASARTQWERNFEGNDPSDACVSVRISSGKPMAGILKKPAASFLHANSRTLLA